MNDISLEGCFNLIEAITIQAKKDYVKGHGKERATAVAFFRDDPYGVFGNKREAILEELDRQRNKYLRSRQ